VQKFTNTTPRSLSENNLRITTENIERKQESDVTHLLGLSTVVSSSFDIIPFKSASPKEDDRREFLICVRFATQSICGFLAILGHHSEVD
jgi:hypothetical protein